MLRTGVMRFRKLKSERGMVLPIALGILSVLSISAVVVLDSSSTNARSSTRSKSDKVAFALAEAGINNAVAVLSKTGNDNMHQSLLPPCKNGQSWTAESTWKLNDGGQPAMKYEGGDVRWCATFDAANAAWNVYARGIVRNHYGTAATTTRQLSAQIPITPIETQPLQNQAWNFMFATRTGTASGCDLTFSNNVAIGSNVYAMGNLCLDNNVVITAPKVIALGKIYVANNGAIGSAGTNNWSTRVEVQLGGAGGEFCKYATGSWTTFSSSPFCGDLQHVYSKNSTSSAMTVNPTPQNIAPPTVDWVGWYEAAIPGPKQTCTSSSGTPPVFDGDTTRNNTTKTLTAHGTIFIDGSVKMVNTAVLQYDGYATLYASGTFLMDNGAKFCAVKNADGTDCDYTGWDPNTQMFTVVTGGSGALAGAQSQAGSTTDGGGNSTLLANNVRFQGALYATNAIQLVNNSKVDGPMIGSTIIVDNNVAPDAFPFIEQAPAGMPGNTNVFAQTQQPRLFSG